MILNYGFEVCRDVVQCLMADLYEKRLDLRRPGIWNFCFKIGMDGDPPIDDIINISTASMVSVKVSILKLAAHAKMPV